MAKWFLLPLFGVIGSLIIYLAFHLGIFRPVAVEKTESPNWTLLYVEHTGPYHRINEAIEKVEALLRKFDVTCPATFGEYLDDPREMEEGRLRSFGGCIFTGEFKVPENLPTPIKVRKEEPGPVYHATFSGSPAIGPYKVYSRVFKIADEQRAKLAQEVLEVYTLLGRGTTKKGESSTKDEAMRTDYYFRIQ